jgi:hypothetical protein
VALIVQAICRSDAPVEDAALAYRLVTNLARQGCPAMLDLAQHAQVTAWVGRCVGLGMGGIASVGAGHLPHLADIVVTMATHPLLHIDGDDVCAVAPRGRSDP